MAKVLDGVLEVREFEQRYYVHFRINTFVKGMNPLIPTIYGLISIPAVFL